jgi:amidase
MKSNASLKSADLCFTPALKLRDMLRRKRISPVELTQAFLERIERVNPRINAYCTVVPELALKMAKQAEADLARGGEVGLLCGLPVSIKDVTMVAGVRTTYGSKLHEHFVPEIDEVVVERVKKAGAVILGKTNTPEFAAGASTFNAVFGVTRNPWDTACTVGGSSGGAAASVAAGIGPLAHGNDLYGSLRIPASFCGVVGFRPSPGRVPWYPNELNWDDFCVQGPIARTVGDVALLLEAMSGPDHRSPVSLPHEQGSFLRAIKQPSIRNMKIAWSDNLNLIPVDPEVQKIARSAMKVFRSLGAEVAEDAPDFSGVRETALVLRGLLFVSLYYERMNDPEFKRLVNPLVTGNIEQGLKYSIRDVAKALRHRSQLWENVRRFFDTYDFLVTLTVPIPPFPAEMKYPTEIAGKPMESYVDWAALTFSVTMVGLPAVSVPCGWTEKGLPVGIQIVGRRHGEAALLRAAAAYEMAASWADKRPPIG